MAISPFLPLVANFGRGAIIRIFRNMVIAGHKELWMKALNNIVYFHILYTYMGEKNSGIFGDKRSVIFGDKKSGKFGDKMSVKFGDKMSGKS